MKYTISFKWPKISIIILNWNGWKDTIECLESLYQITYPNYEIILVDNGSIDESIKKISEYCEGKIKVESQFFKYDDNNKPIKIIEYTREESANKRIESEFENINSNKKLIIIKNEKNYGFAEGNNIGIRYSLKYLKMDYFLLLNNDTVVDRNILNELINVSRQDDNIGAVGPKIYYYYDKNKINFAGGKLFLWRGEIKNIGKNCIDKGQFDKIKQVDFIQGSCFFVKKEIITKIGYLDKDYFSYFEDTDWCIRIKKNGFKLFYAPKAKIWHKIASSTDTLSPLRGYYWGRNSFLLVKKNSKKKTYYLFILYFITFKFWAISIILFARKKYKSFVFFIKGLIDINSLYNRF